MRAIVYHFARNNNYNMTSNYGSADIRRIPFSHHQGATPNFMYGHVRDKFVQYATQSEKTCLMKHDKKHHGSDNTLYIFMIREPSSWIFSRYLHHHYHYNLGLAKEVFQNISEFAMTYAPEYLEFLDDESRDFSLKWFRESMTAADGGVIPISNHAHQSKKLSSPFQSPMDIGNNFEHKLLRCRNSIVLIQDYFMESLEVLNKVFGTKQFTDTLPHGYRYNKLDDNHIGKLTSHDMNSLHRIMQIHHVIYHACLKHFLESYYDS